MRIFSYFGLLLPDWQDFEKQKLIPFHPDFADRSSRAALPISSRHQNRYTLAHIPVIELGGFPPSLRYSSGMILRPVKKGFWLEPHISTGEIP